MFPCQQEHDATVQWEDTNSHNQNTSKYKVLASTIFVSIGTNLLNLRTIAFNLLK